MKKAITISAGLFITMILLAQAPQKISYQAVIRNSSDQLVTEKQVGMQISILKGTADGSPVYTETQTPTTNANGLVSIEIGAGTVVDGDFTNVDWSDGPYFIKTETDPAGNTNYTITGTSQLLSVPYALHAKTAESLTEAITETDPVYSGSEAVNITAADITNLNNLSGTNTGDQDISGIAINAQAIQDTASQIRADIPDVNGFITEETQNLSVSGNQLTITNGNTVTLPGSSSFLPVYTTAEIAALSPSTGEAIYNSTENLYQIYDGSRWVSLPANCWPQPTTSNAGNNQEFTDGTISTTLTANTPEAEHGTGQWSIVSGDGGSFDDDTSPTAVFTGQECTSYQLQWTITTSCNSSSDNVNIIFNQTPTVADAGEDQIFTDGTISTTLAANTPEAEHGTGQWSIVSGDGGSFDDDTNPTAVFTGVEQETYYLRWTISTNCQVSEDDVMIGFYNDGAGNQITDIDGNTYNTVWIGGQNWMAENLKVTKYNDNTSIPNVTDNTEWENLSNGAYAWYDNDKATYGDTYGALYNWYAVETGNLCPSGWHVPTDEEWTTLTEYLGGADVAGGKLKETGTTHWFNPNEGATNESGFTALPGGYRGYVGDFSYVGYDGYWWSATEYRTYGAWYRSMYYGYSTVSRYSHDKEFGFSVRCLRDD
jgi:uncharacterized protein (TIGR02145 family)